MQNNTTIPDNGPMSDARADSRTPAAFQPRHWIGMAAGAVVYALFVVPQWSRAYIDFGDGNYLYIAARIAEGGALYRDILAPQPPCHLYLGALLIKIAGWIGLSTPLYLIRFFSLALHLTTFVLVADLARRAWGSAAVGLMAGVIFLLLPIGLWWSLGYQSEPLEILFLVLMIHFAIRPPRTGGILGSHGRDVAASLFGALAAFTNATAVPFLLVLILFMLWRNPRRAAWIALPALVVAAILIVVMEVWTGGFFLRTVVFDQVGTFPRDRPLGGYIAGKLLREGGDIFRLEGFFIILALLGFFRFLASSPLPSEERQGLAWFCLATMASFLYVAKGGTVDYIFSLGEPAVALLAAGELKALSQWVFLAVPVRAARPVQSPAVEKLEAAADPSPFALRPTLFVPLKAAALGLIALIAMGPAV
ncbi:hypothetical protein IIC65_05920, partial [Candidatus Sumerlaeota bacterium]|nr:hypothetical protein [Candidatus Sumerlaeota bacterium]